MNRAWGKIPNLEEHIGLQSKKTMLAGTLCAGVIFKPRKPHKNVPRVPAHFSKFWNSGSLLVAVFGVGVGNI